MFLPVLNLLFWTMSFFFCLIFLDLLRTMFPLQKCFLYLFISSFRSSSFHLFSLFCLLVFSRFFHLFHSFILNFFDFFIIFMFSLCKTLCQKKKCLFRLQQNSFFSVFSFPSKNYVFSVSFFCWAFFTLIYVPCFLSFSVSWKNGFSFCFTFLFFLILLFNSVSLHYSIYMYPKLKMLLLSWKNVGKTLFSVSDLLV